MTLADGWYNDAETLKAVVKKHGDIAAASRATGVADATLRGAWKRAGFPRRGRADKAHVRLVQPGEKVSELELLRQRVRDYERHQRRAREGEVLEERVILRLEAAVERHGGPLPVRVRRPKPMRVGDNETELALLFSDTHASEVVSLEETMGMNAYDWPTMLGRMDSIADAIVSHKAHFNGKIRRLNLWMLGDMLSGDIHEELAVTNDRPTAEAVVDFAYDVARWIEERFLGEFHEVVIAGVPGNHPRASKKPAAKLAHNNADWLTYKMLEALLRKQQGVSFQLRRGGFNTVRVAGRWNVLLMHGDGIRTTMPGVPWGGVVRRITTLEAQFAKAKDPLDYVCLGHFHTANSLDGVHARTFLNGSVKGLDEYGLKQFGSGRDASQLLLTFHRRRGWTGTLPLDLQTVTPAAEGWRTAA
jgi:hypothetical protein